jgi:hypothetical protein
MKKSPLLFLSIFLSVRLLAQENAEKVCGYYESYMYEYAHKLSQYHRLTITKDSFRIFTKTLTQNYVDSTFTSRGTYKLFNDTLNAYGISGSLYAVGTLNKAEDRLSFGIIHDSKIKFPLNEKLIMFEKDGEVYPNGNLKYLMHLISYNRLTLKPALFEYTTFDSTEHATSNGWIYNGLNTRYKDTFLLTSVRRWTSCGGGSSEGVRKWTMWGLPINIYNRIRIGHWRNGRKIGIWKYYSKKGAHRGKKTCGSFYTVIDYQIRREKYSYKRGLIWSKDY